MKPGQFVIPSSRELGLYLRSCWTAETSATPSEWHVGAPSTGQCAVTALVVEDVFGGYICRCLVQIPGRTERLSHYFNRLPNGEMLDLTRIQFPNGTLYCPVECRDRQYLLQFPDTMRRYGLLLQNLGQYIAREKLRIKNQP